MTRISPRIAVLAAAGAALLSATSASAADPPPDGCTQDGDTVTCSYGYTGAEQKFSIPVDVKNLRVDAAGGRGGGVSFDLSTWSLAGEVLTDLEVTPGKTLYVEVGGLGGEAGSGTGGFNGGGQGALLAGGGGGATDIRTCSRSHPDCEPLRSRLVVAGGGGGLAQLSVGGHGGTPDGAPGLSVPPRPPLLAGRPGGGGTQTAGGIPTGPTAGYGTFGQGGAGDGVNAVYFGGGGGGGGWYGGAGGMGDSGLQYEPGGGGGGSSYGPAGAKYFTYSGQPSVTITYRVR
jgi:hypothetical protein